MLPEPYYDDGQATIYHGDALAVLRELPDESVHCCVTSPPYYALRDYQVDGQMGLEETPAEYITNMVAVFREVRRVLRSDGTFWLNIGSSYSSGIIESEAYVLRDDLTSDELAYVYRELADHFQAQSEAVSQMRSVDASTEQDVPSVLHDRIAAPSELRGEDV